MQESAGEVSLRSGDRIKQRLRIPQRGQPGEVIEVEPGLSMIQKPISEHSLAVHIRSMLDQDGVAGVYFHGIL